MEYHANDIPPDKLPAVRVYLDNVLQSHVTAFDPAAGWVDHYVAYPRAQVEHYADRFFVFEARRDDGRPAELLPPDVRGSDVDGLDAQYVSNLDPAGFAAVLAEDGSESAGVDLQQIKKQHPNVILVAALTGGETFVAIDTVGRLLVNREYGPVRVEGLD
jgi:hypothetical protein